MNPRVTAAMRKAASTVLADAGHYPTGAALVDALCEAVITADDHGKTRYVIGTRDPHGNALIYGPYATADAATKSWETGACITSTTGMQAWVFPLIPAPKQERAPKKNRTTSQQSLI